MKTNPSSKSNLSEIARKCGVNAMTVSRVLRNDVRVKEETRQKILREANQVHYQPSANIGRPRQTHEKQRQVVDVILGISFTPENLFLSQLLSAIERALDRYGCDCVIRTCTHEYESFVSLCNALHHSQAIASLIVGYFPVENLQTILKTVQRGMLVDHTGDVRLTLPYEYVGFDNVTGAHLVMRHLIEMKRRKVVLITGPEDHYFSRDIEQGYRDILKYEKISIEENWIQRADFTAQSAYQLVRDLCVRKIDFDAVFTNDEMAVGVLRALHEHEFRVPLDVAVVGCDGSPLGSHTIPSLSTIRLDFHQLGQLAVERILSSREPSSTLCRMKLVPKLEIRESSSLPPSS